MLIGRVDKISESECPPQGRLPDAAQGPKHIRDVFYRMGFNDREIVALIGNLTFFVYSKNEYSLCLE